jgi:DnaJ domain
MKDYYRIMNLSREASEDEIKRSYRKLAIRYHPDKNPSLEAENVFKEINEAYEVLSDPGKKFQYDQLLTAPGYSGWQEPYATRPQRSRGSRPSDRMIFMQGILHYVQLLFYFGCLWSFVLVIDYALPPRLLEERVTTEVREVTRVLMRNPRDLLVTEKGHHFPVLLSEMQYFPKGANLKIYTSSIFSALIRVENYNGTFVVNNLGSIYRNFSFAPVLLLLCCAVGLIIRKGIEFHVNLGIVVFLLVILNVVFLFKSIV